MDETEKRIRRRLRDDFDHYAKKCLKIRTESNGLQPFIINKSQRYLHEKIENQKRETGKVRAIILKGRQQGCCFSPNMRIMTSDYRWVKISDINVGDKLMAVDEFPVGKTSSGRHTKRRIRNTEVQAKVFLKKEAFEVTFSNGVVWTVTKEHKYLSKQRGGDYARWRSISDSQVGDYIRAFSCPPQDNDPNFEDGWFGGLLDGEGSFGAYPAARISITQVDGLVLERAKKYLKDRNIKYYELIDKKKSGVNSRLGNKEVHCIRIDRQSDILRILTLTRPSRFINKPVFVDKKLPNTCPGFDAWSKILSIKSIGEIDVIDLQTEHKTYICEGFVSHNSTYIEGRFFWLVTHKPGMRAFILTHDIGATNNLFEMAQRFYEYCPLPVRPTIEASNSKELIFAGIDSGYKLGTAGNKAVGRSSTIQLFHGSETGYWPHAIEHAKGIMQAIPNTAGTEVFLESTANGIGNYFHEQWQRAEAGESDFIPIFMPWFWKDEYQKEIPNDFEVTSDESDLMRYHDINLPYIVWRRHKIIELSTGGQNGLKSFMQEYPCTAAEAFQRSGEDSLISPEIIMQARKACDIELHGNLVIGVDPARFGSDRTAIIRRKGRVAYGLESHSKKCTMEVANMVHRIILNENPTRVFIDIGGLGAGVYDRLSELGYKEIIVGVNGGATPFDQKKYYNKRAEMWGEMNAWLNDLPCKIPDVDSLHSDLCTPLYSYDSNSRLVLEKKESMKKRGFRSPDEADALALTFSLPETALSAAINKRYTDAGKEILGAFNNLDRLKKRAYR